MSHTFEEITDADWEAIKKAVITVGAVTGKTFNFGQAQLQLGSTVTPMEVTDFEVELAKCQRYYEKSYSSSVGYGMDAREKRIRKHCREARPPKTLRSIRRPWLPSGRLPCRWCGRNR